MFDEKFDGTFDGMFRGVFDGMIDGTFDGVFYGMFLGSRRLEIGFVTQGIVKVESLDDRNIFVLGGYELKSA